MIFNIAFLVFLSIYMVYCVILYLNGVSDREYVYFGSSLGIYTVYFLVDSGLYLHLIGCLPDAHGIAVFLGTLFPPSVMLFLFSVFGRRLDIFVKFIIYSWVLLGFVGLFEPYFGVFADDMFWIAWCGVSLVSSFVVFRETLVAKSEGFYESTPAMVGVGWLVMGMFFVVLDELDIASVSYYMKHVAVALFMISIEYGLIKRYARYWKNVRHLSESISRARDEERRRLSRDLHDGVGQLLTGIKLNLQMIREDERDKKRIALLDNVVSQMSLAIEDVRNIAMDLRPTFLEKFSLSEVVQWYIARYRKHAGIKIFVNADDNLEADLDIKDNIYRICQEALSNVFKHSRANSVRVSLKRVGGFIRLEIADDGIGFDLEKLRKSRNKERGMGIYTMKERAELMGGFFSVKSTPGKGSTIVVKVPLKND